MTSEPREGQPTGARLFFWLGQACCKAREDHDPPISRAAVAALLERDQQAVDGFERGQHIPRELDDLLAIYGHLTKRDPRDLVQDAIDLWRKQGVAPKVKRRRANPRAQPLRHPPPAPQLRKASGARRTRRRKAG